LPPQEFALAEIPGCSIEGKFDDRFLYDPHMGPDLVGPYDDKPRSELTDKELAVMIEGRRIMEMVGWLSPENQEEAKRRARKNILSSLSDLEGTLTKENPTPDDQRHGIILVRLLRKDLETLGVKTETKETPKLSVNDVRLVAVGGRK
jgi:hypothetical protein